jgi:glycosyltransferase involved in cell wall biosynthesis
MNTQIKHSFAPFSLQGDLDGSKRNYQGAFISCLITAARPPEILQALLADLASQSLTKDRFEIILWDNSPQGLGKLALQYTPFIPIRYFRDLSKDGFIGRMRNRQLQEALGEYVLFLDDDTRLPQKDFLARALGLFKKLNPDILLPNGEALLVKELAGYKFLDPFSFATRCCFYKRRLLDDLTGFRADITAYEDIELGIRATFKGAKIIKTRELKYQHPPLYFHSLQKPLAIGQSILKLRRHYPLPIWLMIYLNALRFLPLGLWPTRKNRQWFKISLGVLCALWTKKRFSYQP